MCRRSTASDRSAAKSRALSGGTSAKAIRLWPVPTCSLQGVRRRGNPQRGGRGAGGAPRLGPDATRARLLRRLDPVVEALDRVDQRIGARRSEGRDLRDRRLRRPCWGGCSYVETPRDARFESAQFHFIQKWKKLFWIVWLNPECR